MHCSHILRSKYLLWGPPYDGFVADQWWKDRDSARQVFLETAKLLLFWVNTEY